MSRIFAINPRKLEIAMSMSSSTATMQRTDTAKHSTMAVAVETATDSALKWSVSLLAQIGDRPPVEVKVNYDKSFGFHSYFFSEKKMSKISNKQSSFEITTWSQQLEVALINGLLFSHVQKFASCLPKQVDVKAIRTTFVVITLTTREALAFRSYFPVAPAIRTTSKLSRLVWSFVAIVSEKLRMERKLFFQHIRTVYDKRTMHNKLSHQQLT